MPIFQGAAVISGESLVVARQIPVMTAVTAAAEVPRASVVSSGMQAAMISPAKLVATPAVDQIRFVDPEFARGIIKLRPIFIGTTRDKLSVPVAPAADFADDALFEDATDPTKHFYLPRYVVAEDRTTGGQARYAIAVRQAGPEWTLAVRLRKTAPTTLGDAARTATELKHAVAIFLRHKITFGGAATAIAEEPFGEVSTAGEFVNATLRLQTLEQRDRVVRALQDTNSGAQLIVRRSFDVAIPVPPPPEPVESPPPPPLRTEIARPGSMAISMLAPAAAPRVVPRMVSIDNGVASSVAFRPPGLPGPAPSRPPTPIPLFRQVNRVLDATADPADFTFPLALHPYIYGDLGAPAGAARSLIRQAAPWRGEDRSYYQDPDDTWLFYYLPDCFKLARRQGPTREPLMSLRFVPAPAGTLGDPAAATRASLDYIAVPVVDPNRLADAAAKLKPLVSVPLPADIDGPRFAPLIISSEKLRLRLRIPGAAGFNERPHAIVNLRAGIKDTLDLGLADFQPLFDALFGAGLTLFTGEVAMDLGDGGGESIPFAARISDMSGDVVDYTAASEGGGLRVKLRNAAESPITIARLPTTLHRGGQTCPATISGADFSRPLSLAPGTALELLLTPSAPLPAGDALEPIFDFSGVTVTPDRDAIYGAILDPTTPTAFSRTVHVVTAEQRFQGASAVARIVVEFEGGSSVDLHTGHVEGDAVVQRPIADFVLQHGSTGAYRYRLQTLLAAGGKPMTEDWRNGSSDIVLV